MASTKLLRAEAKRLGVPFSQMQRAFRAEAKGPDAPLEVPDLLAVRYKYSYGGQSRFFREIRDHARLVGARCTKCRITYCPPRVHCSSCYGKTRWVPLKTTGVVLSATAAYYATSLWVGKVPYVVAYIRLDGADTGMFQMIEMDDPAGARPGMRVKAVFKKDRLGKMSDFHFVPA